MSSKGDSYEASRQIPFHNPDEIPYLLCIFLIIPLIASGFLVYNKSSQLLTTSGSNYANQKLQKLIDSIDRYLQNIETISFDICYNSKVQDILSDFDEND